MKQYDFTELSDYEFEELANDLISKSEGIQIERFARGRDYGIDGRSYRSGKTIIIQSKHYVKTGYSGLKSKILNIELNKILLLKPTRYILSTSVSLSVTQADDLKEILQKAVPNGIVDIYGQEKLNELLRNHQDILKTYYKLWACSAGSLELFISPEIESRQKSLKSRLNTLNKFFVVTEDVKPISKVLNEEHIAIITGEPGVGKTTLAEYICQRYLKAGYKVHVIESDFSLENINLANYDEKVLYYFDDFLGSNYYDAIRGREDSSIVRFLNQIRLEKNKRIILTSRSNIIRKASLLSQSFQLYGIQRRNYIIQIKNHSEITKAKILYNHLWHSAIEDQHKFELIKAKKYKEIITHKNFNPRIVSFVVDALNYSNRDKEDYGEFILKNLNYPTQIWEHCFTAQIDEQLRILVKLVVANGGEIEEEILRVAYDRALKEYSFTRIHNEPIEYEHTIKLGCDCILSRTIVIKNGQSDSTIISHFNPSVSDYVLPKIANAVDGKKLFVSLKMHKVVEQYISLYKNKRISAKESAMFVKSILESIDWREIDRNLVLLIEFGCLINLQSNVFDRLLLKIKEAIEAKIFDLKLSRNSIRNIICNWANDYDWSLVIKAHMSEICLTDDEFYEIYTAYENSKNADVEILNIIKSKIINYIVDTAEDLLTTIDDFPFCTKLTEGEEYLNNALKDLADRFPILNEDEISEISKTINLHELIQKNKDRFDENDNDRDYDPDEYEVRVSEVDLLFDGFSK